MYMYVCVYVCMCVYVYICMRKFVCSCILSVSLYMYVHEDLFVSMSV